MTDPSESAFDAGARIRRLLAMLAYLAVVGEAPIADLAPRFRIDETTVVSELELAACCGLPPYTPDQLLELVVDETTVHAYGLEALGRPPRLTENEGFALAAASRALLAVPGSETGALESALKKLEGVLGSGALSVELARPPNFEVLRRAAARGELVEIDYLGARRGEETTRVVETYQVTAREGRFYLDGYCRLASDWRRFSLDRIVAARPLGEIAKARSLPAEFRGSRAFAGGSNVRRATVAVDPAARGSLDRYTTDVPTTRPDGRLVFTLEVHDERWLGRLLLRLGDTAELVEPNVFARTPREVARGALSRYEGGENHQQRRSKR